MWGCWLLFVNNQVQWAVLEMNGVHRWLTRLIKYQNFGLQSTLVLQTLWRGLSWWPMWQSSSSEPGSIPTLWYKKTPSEGKVSPERCQSSKSSLLFRTKPAQFGEPETLAAFFLFCSSELECFSQVYRWFVFVSSFTVISEAKHSSVETSGAEQKTLAVSQFRSASSEGLGLCGLWRRVLQRDLVNLVSRC